MRLLLALGMLAFCCGQALAEATFHPALSGAEDARTVVVYSPLDEPLAHRMTDAFRRADPDLAVRYEDLQTSGIRYRIVGGAEAGVPTADIACGPFVS